MIDDALNVLVFKKERQKTEIAIHHSMSCIFSDVIVSLQSGFQEFSRNLKFRLLGFYFFVKN